MSVTADIAKAPTTLTPGPSEAEYRYGVVQSYDVGWRASSGSPVGVSPTGIPDDNGTNGMRCAISGADLIISPVGNLPGSCTFLVQAPATRTHDASALVRWTFTLKPAQTNLVVSNIHKEGVNVLFTATTNFLVNMRGESPECGRLRPAEGPAVVHTFTVPPPTSGNTCVISLRTEINDGTMAPAYATVTVTF